MCYIRVSTQGGIMIKRVFEMLPTDARKIRARQKNGTMTEIYDDDGFICYDVDEYNSWKPKKRGRKAK